MEYASFGKRVTGAIIDLFFLIAIFMILGTTILLLPWGKMVDMQEAIFILFNMIFFPVDALFKMFDELSYFDIKYYIIFIVLFLTEVAYYSLMEILPTKGTIGYICTKTCIRNKEGGLQNTRAIILRNHLKTISRYLFGIPFLIMLFMDKNQTIYDLKTKTIVILDESLRIERKRSIVLTFVKMLLLTFVAIFLVLAMLNSYV